MISETFRALASEAEFTREVLASGTTQIRKANYASQGAYFQSFTSLSTGLERIGKLCLMLDHYIDHNGRFPDASYMKDEICHKIVVIYEKSISVVAKRAVQMRFLQDLEAPIHQGILTVLSEFAQGDRYCNINLLVGRRRSDPIASWVKLVDLPLYESCVTPKKRRPSTAIQQLLPICSLPMRW